MRILDLTPDYLSAVNDGALERYTARLPELFNHYFDYWSPAFRHIAVYPADAIETGRRQILSGLEVVRPRLEDIGLDVSGLEIILMVGNGASNGHAVKLGGEFRVWLPVEAYPTGLRAEVFAAHEIIHALHYQSCRDAYFDTSDSKNDVMRQLLTEGIATYHSMQALGLDEGRALWADYLPEAQLQAWLQTCRGRESILAGALLYAATGHNEVHDLFGTSRPDDPVFFRGGYYLGLKCIGALARQHGWTPNQLLHQPLQKLKESALSELSKYL